MGFLQIINKIVLRSVNIFHILWVLWCGARLATITGMETLAPYLHMINFRSYFNFCTRKEKASYAQ